jgi:glycerate dehydrogenase
LKIVVLDGYTLNPCDLSWDELKKLGECTLWETTPPDKIVKRAEKAGALFTNKVVIDEDIISRLPKLKFIGVLATGYNVVDTAAAAKTGITVTNIPAYSTDSVAQMVFSHILNFAQNVSVHAQSVSSGDWAKSKHFAYWKTPQTELSGKTLGIIGFGKIGQAVAKIGLAFGMKIIFVNRSLKETSPAAIQVELDTLLSESDYISINCPLTEDNLGFINSAAISKMKKSAFLVNTGRGQLINEQNLADALNQGRIAGAGLDVLSAEPPSPDNPLAKAANCTITPHIAWATFEARSRMMKIAVNNLRSFMDGCPVNVVN